MTYGPANSIAPFLRTFTYFPIESPQDLRQVLNQMYTEIATSANTHEIGKYETVEILTGQQWFTPNNNQKKRYVFRDVIPVGPIAPGAVATIAHGITGITMPVNIYGVLATAVPDWRPIPYAASAIGNDFITLKVNAVNVVIEVGAGSPAILSGYVILEYLKN